MADLIEQLLGPYGRHGGSAAASSGVQMVRTVKVVHKPWGQERWLVREGRPFGFKLIQIRAGHRTSLQFHERKQEANLVLAGEGYVYLADSRDSAVMRHAISVGSVIDIPAGVVHRIAAETGLAIVEVSTPELDDVIRLEDDACRGNGRISSEHEGSND